MITDIELRRIAEARLQDAEALFDAQRYDGAVYLCGYAVETALKSRICKTLKWSGFPSTKKEFEGFASFKSHELDILLRLAGIETEIKTTTFAEWSAVCEWDPESRYHPVGTAGPTDTLLMMEAVKTLLAAI